MTGELHHSMGTNRADQISRQITKKIENEI